MSASIIVRASSVLKCQVELGIGSIERISQRTLSRQTVREVEAIVDDLREQRFRAERDRDDAARAETQLRAAAGEWGEKAAYILGRDRPDLAEQAVGRQLDAERDADAANARQRAATAEIERLATLSAELDDERRRMRKELAAIEAAQTPATTEGAGATPEQRAERVKARFDRLVEKERLHMRAASTEHAIAEIDAMRRADQVAERLAALRRVSEGPSD